MTLSTKEQEAKRMEELASKANNTITGEIRGWDWPVDFDNYVMIRISSGFGHSYRCASCGRHFTSGFHVGGYYTDSRYRGGYWKRWCGGSCSRNILVKIRDQFLSAADKTSMVLQAVEGLNQTA
jgi:DNA-directed RNA polymerase subunit RPC12/RpoP